MPRWTRRASTYQPRRDDLLSFDDKRLARLDTDPAQRDMHDATRPLSAVCERPSPGPRRACCGRGPGAKGGLDRLLVPQGSKEHVMATLHFKQTTTSKTRLPTVPSTIASTSL